MRIKIMKNKLVYGVGVNDADYEVVKYETVVVNRTKKRKRVWICPFYRKWIDMLERCYSEKYQEKRPTYIGCSVSNEWLTFSNFKSWMENQQWQGCQLDKDILFEGNKIYNADTCVFVSPMVNSFIIDCNASRGQYMIGCYWNKEKKKFLAQCMNPLTKKREHLGYYTTELEAHQAWCKRKLELAHELAAIQTDTRVAEALIKRYS